MVCHEYKLGFAVKTVVYQGLNLVHAAEATMTNLAATLKSILRRTPLYKLSQVYREEKLYREWIKGGRPIPPPDFVKQRTVKEFAGRFGLHMFVETGTFMGDMVYAVRSIFDEIHSIELGMELYQNAKERFAGQNHITILQGDSGRVLGEVLSRVKRPCLFWLDAHYSAGITAKGDSAAPISKELALISQHPLKRDHVILIDDARCFTGEGDYPSVHCLRKWATAEGFDNFLVQDDIIRIFNAAG
jgi:hypothetical protein